jgi:endonuclease/exonuclease/phosphatase family metal-dependent hydrolase
MAETIPDIDILGLNTKAGGFHNYDPNAPTPERGLVLQQFLRRQRALGVDTMSLTDTYRWDEIYGGNAGIAQYLRMKTAHFVRLEDPRSKGKRGEGIGITCATMHEVQQSRALNLGTRQGLGLILDIGKYGLQIATVYLDFLDAERRYEQTRALFSTSSGLEKNVPTIIIGDLNTRRADMANASITNRLCQSGWDIITNLTPPYTQKGKSIASLRDKRVVPFITSQGFRDADPLKRPTTPNRLPIMGLDYAFVNDQVVPTLFSVIPSRGASDHAAIRLQACVPT